MAVSKNNRRKPKKRTKNHMSPQKQVKQTQEKQAAPKATLDWFSIAGFALMLIGFLVATFTSYSIAFYPVTFVGAVMCLMKTKWDTRAHKISFVCYIVYCVAVAIMWVGILTGTITK